eukprot:CAMPEP_0202452092 /NCGR_PEP_ID=MMETSP1360-20130828/10369_1 /ASSEMBLY_ACC=CAM_ASM_000848 /TAXON_ID=515479 /ORGANISM="Licmophora paradoxa, Strain CCMP2313" /LENGTH=172 /DNA_ID=CAMNT_0049070819 /DNA_START=293 /DNA_END=811 /DNA_ORIENTATION=+
MITIATKSKEKGCLLWIAKAFVDQSLNVGTGFLLARTKPAICAMLRLTACRDNRVKELSMESIANLCEESTNARKLSMNSGVLRAVCDGMKLTCNNNNNNTNNNVNEGEERVRRVCVRAVLLLSGHRSSAKRLQKEVQLISRLSQFAVSTDEDVELKQAALHGVVLLAQFAG